MPDKYTARITDISESDFWSSLRVPPGAPKAAAASLREAIRDGQAGRKDDAYRKLAEYHRLALANELDRQRERLLAAKRPSRQRVDDMLANRIHKQGKTVDFGERIDWATREFGDAGLCLFHYLGWVTPAVAHYARTAEPAVGEWLVDLVDDYYARRNSIPRDYALGHHPVYYELAGSIKVNTLIPMYLILLDAGPLPTRTIEAFNKLLLGIGRALHVHSESGYRPGNWQIHGTTHLFELACLMPEFRESGAWKRRGRAMIVAHCKKDFYADGGHKERCWSYGGGVLRDIGQAYDRAQRFGGFGRDDKLVLETLREGYRWFAKSLGPTGHTPAYGDGALGRRPELIEQGRKYFPPGTDEWLGVDRGRSYHLDESGFAIMRNGAGAGDTYLNANVGPFVGWHSHLDTLSVNLWSHGRPMIEECGRFGGYDCPLSLWFRSPECHNLVTIEGQPWSETEVQARDADDVHFHSDDVVDYLSACHTAYRPVNGLAQSNCGVVRRTVVFVKDPGYAIVLDSIAADPAVESVRSLRAHWHSPYAWQRLGDGRFRTRGKAGCLLAVAHTENIRHVETGFDYSAEDSGDHGDWPQRRYLRLRGWMPLGHVGAVGLATLLYPFEGRPPAVSIRPVELAGGRIFEAEAFEVRTPRGTDRIALNPCRLDGVTCDGKPFTARADIRLARNRARVVVR